MGESRYLPWGLTYSLIVGHPSVEKREGFDLEQLNLFFGLESRQH